MIGASLNQYRVTANLGAGGMGEVFRARDTRLNRDVAIKVLPKDFVADADRLRRFEQESKTLAALNHPNILTIHDAGVHEGAPYLISELLEGKTLREVLGSGHVLYQRVDAVSGIWAFTFSLERMERTGEPFRVSDVGSYPSASSDGTLVFSLESDEEALPRQLAWVDRRGSVNGTIGPPIPALGAPRISADGKRIVASVGTSDSKLWMFEAASGGATAFTRGPGDTVPHWDEQGRLVWFVRRNTAGGARLMAKAADGLGAERVLVEGLGGYTAATAITSRDGLYVLASQRSEGGKLTIGYGIATNKVITLTPVPDAYQKMDEFRFSPDARLLAYTSSESARKEVYAVRFPEFTERVLVSRDGGQHPQWHPKGAELFFMNRSGRALMSARAKPNGGFDEPVKVFDLPEEIHGGFSWFPALYDVAPDGERFVMHKRITTKSEEAEAKADVLVVQDWFEEFRNKK